jgi:hypothetical protein
VVGAADLADLAGGDEPVECFESVLDRGVFVGLVQLVEVYAVGAEPPQAVLHGPLDPTGACPAPVRIVAQLYAELRRDDDLVAARAERSA